jgi:hypothetical protein
VQLLLRDEIKERLKAVVNIRILLALIFNNALAVRVIYAFKGEDAEEDLQSVVLSSVEHVLQVIEVDLREY